MLSKTTAALGTAAAGLVVALTAACSADTASSGRLGPTTGEDDDAWPFRVEEVDDFDEPWAMAFLPGRRPAGHRAHRHAPPA